MSTSDQLSYQSEAVPPGAVFVASGECALVFPSAAAAQKLLKPSDVVEGLYPCAYGPNGEPYRVACDHDRVLVEPTGERARPDGLRSMLLRHLEECEDPADGTQSLQEIVAIAWSIERNFCLRNDPFVERLDAHIPVLACAVFLLGLGALWYFEFR